MNRGQSHQTLGHFAKQSVARSKARDTCKTRSSRWRGPTIWSPTGRPAFDMKFGAEI